MAVVIWVTVLYFQVCISSVNVREENFLNSLNTSSTNNESCALISEFFNKKSKRIEEEQTHEALYQNLMKIMHSESCVFISNGYSAIFMF